MSAQAEMYKGMGLRWERRLGIYLNRSSESHGKIRLELRLRTCGKPDQFLALLRRVETSAETDFRAITTNRRLRHFSSSHSYYKGRFSPTTPPATADPLGSTYMSMVTIRRPSCIYSPLRLHVVPAQAINHLGAAGGVY